MSFRAPIPEFRFLFEQVIGFGKVNATLRFADMDLTTVEAILSEAGKLCEEVLAPVRRSGDVHPAHLESGVVRTSPGFAEAYRAIAEGGWVAVSARPEYGGMGLPLTVSTAINDMMSASCPALQLNPLMTQGQIEALENHASEAMRGLYLPKLVNGEWCGTMNLTEPQAGSDVGALRSKAKPIGDGSYAITGQKIFISWADNDFSENVCHLVLARLPDAAPGTKGLSLFLVPKLIPDPNGKPGAANSLRVVSLEHKMGLHGSPTAVMQYDGATGWIVGREHGGMAAMFTMMNNARLGVGVQGIGCAEGAFQQAFQHAMDRRQGRSPVPDGTGAIIDHADVRRMLATMKAELFAARSIALSTAVALDMAGATDDPGWRARAALLTPIAKAYGTDSGIAVAEMGIQVHGGMGYIEETGAGQFYRDVRVTAIYEGTNGIQSIDLVGRKMMDGGAAANRLIDEIMSNAEAANHVLPGPSQSVSEAAKRLRDTTEWLVAKRPNERYAVAVPYLRAFARVLGGHYHLKAAVAGRGGAREALARFFLARLLPEHIGLCTHVREGSEGIDALGPEALAV
ncbi:MAG: acyl-CoA dehydrogenase [Rhodobacter sp.]|nr:acyl-CoA dehydrogenase [Rhodobacter sp.]